MRHLIRTALLVLVGWVGYLVVRAAYRAVRRAMGLPIAEPSQEQRLLRQAIIGTLSSLLVPFAYLHLDPAGTNPWMLLLMSPAFFGAGVLWVSGVKGLVGLYRIQPRFILHPTVFLCCAVAAFSAGLACMVVFGLIRQSLP